MSFYPLSPHSDQDRCHLFSEKLGIIELGPPSDQFQSQPATVHINAPDTINLFELD